MRLTAGDPQTVDNTSASVKLIRLETLVDSVDAYGSETVLPTSKAGRRQSGHDQAELVVNPLGLPAHGFQVDWGDGTSETVPALVAAAWRVWSR